MYKNKIKVMRFWITTHCQERYISRVNNGIRCGSIDILKDISKGKDITNEIYDSNPRYIMFLYEKYKSANQKIIKSGHNLYIVKKRQGALDLFEAITCFVDQNKLEEFKNTILSRQDIFIQIKLLKSKYKL